MKEIIINHLSNNYKITLNSYTTFKLLDISSDEERYLRGVMNDTIELMGITDREFEEAWDEWIDGEIKRFENFIVDLQYKIYEQTGIEINLHEPKYRDIVKILPYSKEVFVAGEGIVQQIQEHNTHNYG